MPNPKALQELTTYLPRSLVARVTRRPESASEPVMEDMPAAVLFADVVGFTAMAERYGRMGPRGTERFTSALSAYFKDIIDIISGWGGDVEKIAGDAVLAYWPVPESRDIDLYGTSLQAAR